MKNKWYVKIWSEGKYLDFWSITHILGGGLLAGFFFLLNFSFWSNLIITFFVLIIYDIVEIIRGIKETKANRVLDIITGLAGFFIMYYLMSHNIFDNPTLFFITLSLFVALEIWGHAFFEESR